MTSTTVYGRIADHLLDRLKRLFCAKNGRSLYSPKGTHLNQGNASRKLALPLVFSRNCLQEQPRLDSWLVMVKVREEIRKE